MTVSIVKQNEQIEKMDRNKLYEKVLNRIEVLAKEKHQVWKYPNFTSDILEQIERKDISDFEKLKEIQKLTINGTDLRNALGIFANEISRYVDITGACSCNYCSQPFLSSDLSKIKRLDTDLLYHSYCFDEMKAFLNEKNSEGIKE